MGRGAAQHNGLIGTVRSTRPGADGRWDGEISRTFNLERGKLEAKPGKNGVEVSFGAIPAAQLVFKEGAVVLLQNLKAKPEYNGEWAKVVASTANDDGRWEVEVFFNGETKRLLLKPENLAPEVCSKVVAPPHTQRAY